eukprot:tig00020801_g13955.t1
MLGRLAAASVSRAALRLTRPCSAARIQAAATARAAYSTAGGPTPGSSSGSSSGSGSGSSAPVKELSASTKQANRMTLLSVLMFGAVSGGLYYVFHDEKKQVDEHRTGVRSTGAPALGGRFQLLDHYGRTVTVPDSYLGDWLLIYFGFTNCPDICPDELEKLSQAVDIIDLDEKLGPRVVPMFISIDPARDTVTQVATYVKEFHPRMVGLTGTVEQVREAAKAYRVYFSKGEVVGEDYLVDHSIIMYLVDPEGNFKEYFGKSYTAPQMASKIAYLIRQRESERPFMDRVRDWIQRRYTPKAPT